MLSKLNYTQKQKLILPLMVLGLLLCWFLAFDKTFEAIKLNRHLAEASALSSDISFNPAYEQRKLAALDAILKGYQVRPNWNDALWMASSAIADKQGVAVDFTLNRVEEGLVDSAAAGASQSLYFHGRYVQLVKLVDTLERMKGIGKIAGMKLNGPKADAVTEGKARCDLRLDFVGLEQGR